MQGVRPNFASLFRFLSRSFLASPYSCLALRVPCVLSRCGEDLTASLSSQQESEFRDRCAKFKARTLEKSSLTYDLGPRVRVSLVIFLDYYASVNDILFIVNKMYQMQIKRRTYLCNVFPQSYFFIYRVWQECRISWGVEASSRDKI